MSDEKKLEILTKLEQTPQALEESDAWYLLGKLDAYKEKQECREER